ncbi:MAG: MazG nucleotide pyrophosphohydrolase domain-containing protein [Candidatus Babeliales bacterium]
MFFITPKTKEEILMGNNTHITNPAVKNHQAPVSASNLSPSISLDELQAYIHAVIKQRGFGNESAQDLMLLMVEEVGELAKALRKLVGLKIDQQKAASYTSVEEEVADVFIYLLDLCNVLNIDLFTALKNKELKNEQRFWSK